MVSVQNNSLCCNLCLGPVVELQQAKRRKTLINAQSVNYLWNYLYHKNVRETHSSPIGRDSSDNNIPALTFSLSLGKSESSEKSVIICVDCRGELENLDKLHRELEAVKKRIDAQVQMITENRYKGQTESGKIPGLGAPKLQMSMGGSVVGKENIEQTVRFLGNLCDGLMTTNSPSISESNPAPQLNTAKNVAELNADQVMESQFDPAPDPITSSVESSNLLELGVNSVMKVEVGEVKVHRVVLEGLYPNEIGTHFLSNTATEDDDNQSPETGQVHPQEDPLAVTEELTAFQSASDLDFEAQGTRSNGSDNDNLDTFTIDLKNLRGATPFQCPLCPKTFLRRDNLKKHQLVHTGEKPFTCEHCGRRFSRKENHKAHKKRVHKV